MSTCRRAPRGWKCIRSAHADGPCAAVPRWYNLRGLWGYYLGKTQRGISETRDPLDGTSARRYAQRRSEIPPRGSETPGSAS